MTDTAANVIQEHLPFYITGPGESNILFTAVTITLVLVLIGFGALYFTIQFIPDRRIQVLAVSRHSFHRSSTGWVSPTLS